MSTYKQEMREPEPSKHPDERMHVTIKDPALRFVCEKKVVKLAPGEKPQ